MTDQIITISIKQINGNQRIVRISPQSEVFELICQISNRLNYEPQHVRLIYSGKDILDPPGKTLRELGIQDGCSLSIVLRLCGGGGFPPSFFSNLTDPVYKEFTLGAPSYRIIYPGFNLEGICRKLRCQALDQKTWCKKGYGKFILNIQIIKSECPLCKQKLQNVENMGLYKGKAIIKGVKSDGQEFKKTYINSEEKLLTFEDKVETKCNWAYLEITVENL